MKTLTPPERLNSLSDYLHITIAELASSVGYERPQAFYDVVNKKTKAISSRMANSITSTYPEINITWLVAGIGDMLLPSDIAQELQEIHAACAKEIEAAEKEYNQIISCKSDPVHEGEYNGTLVYDINATAGFDGRDIDFTQEHVVGCICLPEIDKNQQIIGVSGDSMEPVLKNFDRIAIRKIENWTVIFWGQIYVVMTDEYRFVKYVKPHPTDKNYILLKSENSTKYDDIELHRNQIRSMFLVTNVLRVETRAI